MLKANKRIALLGPESSGKTTLCRYLAKHFKTAYAHEYVRGYLRRGNSIASKEELFDIALKQLEVEKHRAKKANQWLFCDTELINLKVWSEVAFGACDERLLDLLASHRYDLYLLLRPNLTWSSDGLREGQLCRNDIFARYKGELERLGASFVEIAETGEARNLEALACLKAHFDL